MQGTLNEIDLRSILQLLELGQRTGQLWIEARPSGAVDDLSWQFPQAPRSQQSLPLSTWLVFFVNGQIVYGTDDYSPQMHRLQDYLVHYHLTHKLEDLDRGAIAETTIPEYAALWRLLETQTITVDQARHILQAMVQETLFALLSLHQGHFNFQLGTPFGPQLSTYAVTSLLFETVKKVQKWKQLYPQIQFPQQRLLLAQPEKLAAALPAIAYQKLAQWTTGETTLRQLARYLNRDLVALARALLPYIQKGWLQVLDPLPPQSLSRPSEMSSHQTWRILCIDDDFTIGKAVEQILSTQGYQVHLVQNPLEAIQATFAEVPHLILCDIAMPHLDGHEICMMLRHSKRFQNVPIIMLTGQEQFINRIQADFAGATDYLTKPFGQQELLTLLEKYLPNH
ncbi:response regulator [Picosynechococcus sp. PCC 7117]|uniref:response regulator n=1 Tax=Picosynechococcus sp. PCC 7117 TaxID=195498 RepID=UPI000810EC75|nr:response regulator [Picosynechococcus sp. PCC 7117]ANV87239.1 two-component system response regulator [Picosynechococcus sp. PCC 7117]